MMTKIEDIKRETCAIIKAVHEANMPEDFLVDFPNHGIVDIEKQEDPFVKVDFDLTGLHRAALGEKELLAPCKVLIYHHYRTGTGTLADNKYTDMLNEHMGMQQIGSLSFSNAVPIPVNYIKGWETTMNSIGFDVVAPLDCA